MELVTCTLCNQKLIAPYDQAVLAVSQHSCRKTYQENFQNGFSEYKDFPKILIDSKDSHADYEVFECNNCSKETLSNVYLVECPICKSADMGTKNPELNTWYQKGGKKYDTNQKN